MEFGSLVSALYDAWLATVTSTRTLAIIGLLLVVLAIDIAKRGWRMSWLGRAVDGVLATLAIFHLNILFVPIVYLGSEFVRDLYGLLHIPSLPTELWAGVPVWILTPFAILVRDFADYWNHRAMHVSWLWPIHAIHHSESEVNGLSSYRIHFLESLFMWSSYVVILTWLGLPADAIGVGAIFLALHNVYVHIDVDWDHGPFRLLLASPRFHRWHHADKPEAHGKNLANVFPFFDWLFGTYYNPGRCDAPLGFEGSPRNDVVRLMVWPFMEWGRMIHKTLTTTASRLRADPFRQNA